MNTDNGNDVMLRLQQWYQEQCNDDWEHSYGVDIGTLDNPGWRVEIDLAETPLEHKAFSPVEFERSDDDWYGCRVRDKKYIAACDPLKLLYVIKIFLDWACSTTMKSEL